MSTSKTKPKPKGNKQHDARAASFLRIAKALRFRIKNIRKSGLYSLAEIKSLRTMAEEIEDEGKYLRTLR